MFETLGYLFWVIETVATIIGSIVIVGAAVITLIIKLQGNEIKP